MNTLLVIIIGMNNYCNPENFYIYKILPLGPTSFQRREATFLHFELEDETRDFFTVSYFVFDDYDGFSARFSIAK